MNTTIIHKIHVHLSTTTNCARKLYNENNIYMYNKEENRKYFVISLIDLKSRNAPYCGFVINFLTRIQ